MNPAGRVGVNLVGEHEGVAMRFAYVDPPYLGMGAKMYGHLHPEAAEFDKIETHAALIDRLSAEYGAWAYSLTSTTLQDILPLCPADVRVGAWVKPFCSFKPNVNPAYAWEPVIFRGGRKRDRASRTVRDFVSTPITMLRGFPGAKPAAFCWWIFDLLGAEPEDEFHDIFPGSGAVGRAWTEWCRVRRGFPMLELAPHDPPESHGISSLDMLSLGEGGGPRRNNNVGGPLT